MKLKFLTSILILQLCPQLFAQDSIREFDISDWVTPLKDSVLDIDGNVYHTQQIGTQVWMLENLKTTHFNNGKAISALEKNDAWIKAKSPAYATMNGSHYNCNRELEPTTHLLYNYYVINDSSKVCPSGWHVPSPNEWDALQNYMSRMNIDFLYPDLKNHKSGEPLTPSIKFIYSPYEIGFNSMLYGCRSSSDGSFNHYGSWGYWWSTNPTQIATAWYGIIDRGFGLEDVHLEQEKDLPNRGYAIKCIKTGNNND